MVMKMYNWGRKIKIDIGLGSFVSDGSENSLEIRFRVPFDDDSKPNESKVEIYNLSESTISQLKRGDDAVVQAGYGEDIGVIESGKVNKVLTRKEGVDKITTIYIIAGEDFSTVKVSAANADKSSVRFHKDGAFKGQVVEDALSIGFKPGTDGLTIIKRMVSAMGIKLGGPITLKKNMIYKKGYVATKLMLNNLEEVVRDCGSVLYHRRGKLIIRPIDEGTDEKFLLEEATGLLETPSQFQETDKKGTENREVMGYKFKCLLQHRITVASIIQSKSSTANGKYRVLRGEHIADKDDFKTEFQAI